MVHVIERQTRANTAGPAHDMPVGVRTPEPDLASLFGLPARPATALSDPTGCPQDDMAPSMGIGRAAGLSLAIWFVIAAALYLLM
jgi:hypothetical protein